ncbi:MAG: MBL fold metallo-hydrolase, partial [Ktedonobacteraceae bacterium]|nr:MBL fold metallo-hydrolase [Ktedonobacteraceae bacterium]
CLIIDSGMDKDAGRDILKQVKKLGLTPTALLVTHAHADHFGGAHYLVGQTGLKVYATRVEAAVMASPILSRSTSSAAHNHRANYNISFFWQSPVRRTSFWQEMKAPWIRFLCR